MAAPGHAAKAKQQKSLDGWRQIAGVLGSAVVRCPTLGKIRDARHPRGVGACRLRPRN
jgi:hypothetical protein